MANFTPQEIEQFLQEFFDVVGTRQYIGARYVPMFGRRGEESIAWDDTAPYEPLTIVLHQGTSYTSRTFVPAGIDISNETYWAKTGDYDAQVEAYRREVVQLEEDWVDWKGQTLDDLNEWKDDTVDDFMAAIDNIPQILPSSAFDATNTVKKYIDDSVADSHDGILLTLGDSWVGPGNYTHFIQPLAAKCGCELVNYGVGAQGFDKPGPAKFPVQLQNAISGMTADEKLRTRYVVLCGGVNDLNLETPTPDATIRTILASMGTTVQANYPNAKFFYVPNIPSPTYMSETKLVSRFISLVRSMLSDNLLIGSNVLVLRQMVYWYCCGSSIDGFFTGDGLHIANDAIGNYYAGCVWKAMNGMSIFTIRPENRLQIDDTDIAIDTYISMNPISGMVALTGLPTVKLKNAVQLNIDLYDYVTENNAGSIVPLLGVVRSCLFTTFAYDANSTTKYSEVLPNGLLTFRTSAADANNYATNATFVVV